MVAGGLLAVPSWASQWSKATIPAGISFLSSGSEALLAEIVGVIIPATDTPGAKELGVDKMVTKIVADCYNTEVQEMFAKGLLSVEEQSKKTLGKSFAEGSAAERLAILKEMEKADRQTPRPEGQRSFDPQVGPPPPTFFVLLKDLTILGYTNSEYVMTELTGYVAVPGHYYGCVPYTPKKPI